MAKQHSPRFLKIATDAQSQVKRCNVDQVHEWLNEKQSQPSSADSTLMLVDVREESERAAGHIPGSIAIGRGILERDIEKFAPEPGTKIVLYCGGGFRSALAAESLEKMGYTNVLSMDGGWSGWKEAKLPTIEAQ